MQVLQTGSDLLPELTTSKVRVKSAFIKINLLSEYGCSEWFYDPYIDNNENNIGRFYQRVILPVEVDS